jgi:monoterpene epsilon-lactone hydrolase
MLVMVSRRHAAPSSISREARNFIDRAPLPERLDISPAGIAERRKQSYATYAPVGDALRQSLGLQLRDEEIAGVRVQCVLPAKPREDQSLLYFFGGGYVEGSPAEDLAITARLAALLRRRVYVPYYRLAPEHPSPAAVNDGYAVYEALLLRAEARSLAVAGESAGGGLALAMLLRAADAGLAMPKAVALMSPWTDLSRTGDSLTTLAGADPGLEYELNLEPMARAYAGGQELRSPAVSPLYAQFPAGFPPTLITTGTRDLLLSDCARLATKMRHAGIAAELRVWEGLWHVFEFYPEIPEGNASLKEIAAFLEGRLGIRT